ncbi:MAG: gliding motility-associated C-terminal domain-containing protein [Candidatus Zixiibacteriota bacterium]
MNKRLFLFTVCISLITTAFLFASDEAGDEIDSLNNLDGSYAEIEPDGVPNNRIEVSSGGLTKVLSTLDAMDEVPNTMRCRLDTAAVDIVFCMDTSGSMGPIIDELTNAVADFVTELELRRYDYHLGGVTFENNAFLWDFDGATPGFQMTDDAAVFQAQLAATGEYPDPVWEAWEVSLDAMADAINLYDWRDDAVHVIIMFTNEGSHFFGDTALSEPTITETHSDETFTSVHNLVLSSGAVVFINAQSRPAGTGSPIPAEHLDSLQWIAEESGGEFFSDLYPTPTFDPVLDAVLDLLDTYVAIGAYIENDAGVYCDMNTMLMPVDPGCVTILSDNPLPSVGLAAGEEGYFPWNVVIDSSCTGAGRCFQIRVWGCGDEDTIYGCTTDDTCFGYTDLEVNYSPPILDSSCLEITPNPIPLTFELVNYGIRPATDVMADLDLSGSLLTLAGGDPDPYDIGYLEYETGSVMITWNLDIPPSAYGSDQCIDVVISHAEGPDTTVELCIHVPSLRIMPEVTVDGGSGVVCEGECIDVTSDITPSGSWSYSWTPTTGVSDPSSPNPTICPTATTTYTLFVTDGDDCEDSDELTIEVAPPIDADAGPDIEICSGDPVEIGGSPTGSGGYGSLSYSWSPTTGLDNPTSPNPTATIEGEITYTVTVTDEAGCEATDDVIVQISPEVIVDAGPDEIICDGESIEIGGSPTGSGGYGTLTYSWTPTEGLDDASSSNPTATPTSTTTYTVTVTDEFGCEETDDITIEISPPITADAGPDTTICNGDDFVLGGTPSGSGGTAPLTYSWSPSGSLDDPTSANPTASPTSTTTYTLTVTDDAGCEETDEVTITISPDIIADAGPDQDACDGESIELGGSPTGDGGSAPLSYSWSPTTGLDDATSANPTATISGTATYTVTVTDIYGCEATDEITINVSDPIIVDAGDDETICEGEEFILGGAPTATGGTAPLTYSWSPAASLDDPTSTNPTATPTSTTTYTVRVTDDLGCYVEESVTITISPTITVDPGDDIMICDGESIELGGSPTGSGGTAPLTYSWTPTDGLDDPSSSNPTATPTSNTTYTVRVEDAVGCWEEASVTVELAPPIIVDAGDDEIICRDETYELGGTPTATGGHGALNYSWTPTTGLDDPTSPNPNATVSTTTTYTVTVTDEIGCEETDEITITISPDITADAGRDTTICEGASFELGGSPTGEGGTAPLTYSWSPAASLDDPTSTNPTATPTSTTTYTVTVTDGIGCEETDEVTISIDPPITADAGSNEMICDGDSYTLGGSPTASGGTAPYEYIWTPTDGLDDPTSSNPTASPTSTTTYTVVITDIFGCEGTDDITVEVADPIVINPCEGDTLCEGFSLTLGGSPTATGGYGDLTYSWTPTASLDDPSLPNPEANPTTTTTYTITVTDELGCSESEDITITVSPEITADAGADDTLCSGESAMLGSSPAADGGIPPYEYEWIPTDGLDDPASPNPRANPDVNTEYVLTVTDVAGCEDVDTVNIVVSPPIDINIGDSDTLCEGFSLTLGGSPTATGGTGTLDYLWTPAASLDDPTSPNPEANPTVTTTYELTVTDELGCEEIAEVTITVSPEITANAGPDDTLCYSESMMLGGSPTATGGIPPYEYSWTPTDGIDDPTSENPRLSPDVSNTYFLEVTDIAGCTDYDTVHIEISPEIVLDLTDADTICQGESIELGGSPTASGGTGDLEYLWSPAIGLDDPTSPNPMANPSATTTYHLIVTDEYGCTEEGDVIITVSPTMIADAGSDDTLCPGEDAMLGGSPTITGGIAEYTYEWTPSSAVADPSASNPRAMPDTTTEYIVTITDIAGCVAVDTVLIFVSPVMTVDAGDNDTLCQSESIIIGGSPTAEGGYGDLSYEWTPSVGLDDPYIANPDATPMVTTTYTVRVTDELGCMQEDSITIIVSPDMIADAGEDHHICYGDIGRLGGAEVIGGIPPFTYEWTPSATVDDPTAANTEASPTSSTEYTLVVTDAAGCVDTSTIVIEVAPPIDIDAGPDTVICAGESVELGGSPTATGGEGVLSYTWFPRDGLDDFISPNPIATPFDTTTYILTVEDAWGCSAVDTVTVDVIGAPTPPELVSPEDDSSNVPPPTVTLDWEESEGYPPILYDVYMDGVLLDSNLTETEYIADIECDQIHNWHVIAHNRCGDSAPSEAWNFATSVSPTPATPIIPLAGSTVEYPGTEFAWFSSEGGEPIVYDLYINGTRVAVGLEDTTYEYDIECDMEYEWYVVSMNICDTVSSVTSTFYTPQSAEAPELIAPPDRSVQDPPFTDLIWHTSPGTGPIEYEVFVNDSSRGVVMDTFFRIDVECDMEFDWYVVAMNACGEWPSEEWSFEGPDSPTPPELISPSEGEIEYLPRANFVWHTSEGTEPIYYDFYFDGMLMIPGTTDTTCSLYIDCDMEYEWQVVARNICGETPSETWSFPAQDCGSPTAELITPRRGTWSACDDQEIVIYLFDSLGIIEGTIELTVNDISYEIDAPELTFDDDTLKFTPSTLWEDGDSIHFCLDRVSNTYGAETRPFCSHFFVDLSPPYAINFVPADGDTIMDPYSIIEFDIYDTLSGLDESSIELDIPGYGIVTVDSPGVSFDGEHFAVDLEDAGIELERFTPLEFCVSAHDDPDYCEPNEIETCWNTTIYGEGPVATIIEPLHGTYTACDDQRILILLEDEEGVDSTTIILSVEGTEYDMGDRELSFVSDTLIYTPFVPWEDGQEVDVELIRCDDIYGYEYEGTLAFTFTVDLSEPVPYDFSIAPGAVVSDSMETIIIRMVDSLSGLDASSIVLYVDGIEYDVSDLEITWRYTGGDSIAQVILEDHEPFMHDSTVEICMHSTDNPDYCDPNILDSCYTFTVDLLGPFAEGAESGGIPIDSTFSACDDQGFCFRIIDSPTDHGVDESSIIVSVEGVEYTTSDAEVTYDGVNLCFEPAAGAFTDGQIIDVELIEAEDIYGNPLIAPYSFSYTIDLTPPYIASGARPEDGVPIGSLTPRVRFPLMDDLAGVWPESTVVCVSVNGGAEECFGYSHLGLFIDDDEWVANFARFDLGLSGGDTIDFCVHAADAPDFCTPNNSDTCWSFYIPRGSPIGEILEPYEDTYSACSDQGIFMRIFDVDGINESTIQFEVDGTVYSTSDDELTFYEPDSLVFLPPVDYADGHVVECALLAADDMLGNELAAAPIEWSFTIDLTHPIVDDIVPVAGEWVTTLCPIIEFTLFDSLAGLDESSVSFTVDGVSGDLSSAGITWSDPNFDLDLCDFGMTYVSEDTVLFCLEAGDGPDYCDANELDTCWILPITTTGPEAEIITPEDGVISACDPQQITILLTDDDGIDESTIVLMVDSVEYRISSPYLELDGDMLTFDGGDGFFSHGDTVTVDLVAADDIHGRPLMTPLSWSFTLDYVPPVVDFMVPGDGAIVGDLSPLLTFFIDDDFSGVDPASIEITIDVDSYYESDAAVMIVDDTLLHFEPDAIPIEWEGGDTIEVCLHLEDSPDSGYCDANATDECYSFSIVAGGPEAEPITPSDGSITACDPQEIRILLEDDDGIDDASVVLAVLGIEYRLTDPELFWIGDTLVFDGGVGFFPDGTIIDVELISAEDIYHNPLMTPVSFLFWVDYSSPIALSIVPDAEPVISDADIALTCTVIDSISGIDISSVEMLLNDSIYPISALTYSWSVVSGDSVLSVALPHDSFEHNDTVEVCITAGDRPDYCPPNMLDECIEFMVDLIGPAASGVLTPDGLELDGVFTSCDDQGFCFELVDVEVPHGVDASTIELDVGGTVYGIDHPALSYDGIDLCFEPGAIFSDGEYVEAELLAADDSLGNPLSIPISFAFTVDLEPPVLTGGTPPHRAIIGELEPDVEFTLGDDVSGVEYDSVAVCITSPTIGTICYDLDDAGFSRAGADYTISFSDIGIHLEGGDETEICVTAGDLAEICGANVLDTCWNFRVPAEGPIADPIEPLDSTFSACADQEIIISLYDTTGIVETSIQLDVNGTVYTTADPELEFFYLDPPPDSLVWTPPADWLDGDIVNVSLLAAEDSLGNELYEAPIEWMFTIDLTPPVITGLMPPPDTMLTTLCPIIDFDIGDMLSGLDESSLYIVINGDSITTTSLGVDWDGSHFSLDICDFGMPLSGGDTVDICIHAHDRPDYCAVNSMDSCYTFVIEGGGPEPVIVSPFDGAFSACNPQPIRLFLDDEDGIMESSIIFDVNGTDYTTSNPMLSLVADTLIFDAPLDFFSDGDTVYVTLEACEDSLRNPISGAFSFNFILDLSAPEIRDIVPITGSEFGSLCPTIEFDAEDDLSGLDTLGMTITVNGSTFDITSPGVSWDTSHFEIELCDAGLSLSGGDTVNYCINAYDMPDICPPNVIDTCGWFVISSGGPVVEIDRPADGSYSACDPQDIRMIITDPDGVIDSTVLLAVNEIEYGIDAAELSWHGDTLVFDLGLGSFEDGEMIDVELRFAEDVLHNPIDSPITWSFYLDYTPPIMWNEYPAPSSTVPELAPDITINIYDSLSGVDDATITMIVDGVSYTLADGALDFVDSILTFDSDIAGVSWEGGDTVDVCVISGDSPDYCDPNMDTLCWWFEIPAGGPIPDIVRPTDSTISACEDEAILIALIDLEGVDESTIELMVDSISYDISHEWLSFENDTLAFEPDIGFWADGDTVDITLVQVFDVLGNPSTFTPLSWSFVLDVEPPEFSNISPAQDTTLISEWQYPLSLGITDDVLGLNLDSLRVEITGIYRSAGMLQFTLDDPALSFVDDTLRFDPAACDDASLGIAYQPLEDSLTGTGVYYPEFADIGFRIYARENEPDYCDAHIKDSLITVHIGDDDTLAPTFERDYPDFIGAVNPFDVSILITDFTGVYDNSTTPAIFDEDSFGVRLIYDFDGEIDSSYNTIELDMDDSTGDGIIINPDSSITYRFTTTEQVTPPGVAASFVYRCYAYDSDYDFMNHDDHSLGVFNDTIPVFAGPDIDLINPQSGQVTACDDQEILIMLYDEEGVDESSILMVVNDVEYTLDHSWLNYYPDDSLLAFTPSTALFSNNEHVDGYLAPVADMYGNYSDTLFFDFYVDIEAPILVIENPEEGALLSNNQEQLIINISDNLAGVRVDSLVYEINGDRFVYPEQGLYWESGDGDMSGNFIFDTENTNLEFLSGDTVQVTAYVADNPDIDDCGSNSSQISWWFTLEAVKCFSRPDPFTPNDDSYNDIAVFSFPGMFADGAELEVFDRRKQLIYERKLDVVNRYTDFQERLWDGTDQNGKKAKTGLYFYIISRDGEIICEGTITLVR